MAVVAAQVLEDRQFGLRFDALRHEADVQIAGPRAERAHQGAFPSIPVDAANQGPIQLDEVRLEREDRGRGGVSRPVIVERQEVTRRAPPSHGTQQARMVQEGLPFGELQDKGNPVHRPMVPRVR